MGAWAVTASTGGTQFISQKWFQKLFCFNLFSRYCKTKCHMLDGLNYRDLLSPVSTWFKVKKQELAGFVLLEGYADGAISSLPSFGFIYGLLASPHRSFNYFSKPTSVFKFSLLKDHELFGLTCNMMVWF